MILPFDIWTATGCPNPNDMELNLFYGARKDYPLEQLEREDRELDREMNDRMNSFSLGESGDPLGRSALDEMRDKKGILKVLMDYRRQDKYKSGMVSEESYECRSIEGSEAVGGAFCLVQSVP